MFAKNQRHRQLYYRDILKIHVIKNVLFPFDTFQSELQSR